MRTVKITVSFAILFSIGAAHIRLGPRDGGNLRPTDLERIKVGDQAPDFTLEDTDGSRISLSDFRGRKHVVLVFYRGHW